MFNIPGNQTETPMRYQTGSDDEHAYCLQQNGELETLRPCGWSITWPQPAFLEGSLAAHIQM